MRGWSCRDPAARAGLSVAAVLLLGFVMPASALATPGPADVVMAGRGFRVVIDRQPFRLRFLSPAGVPALEEVPAVSAPSLLAPTIDPVPPGTDASASGQLYAPLSFLVGHETLQQYPGLVWGGNLMSGERFGVQYSARSVTAVRTVRDGVELTVSTDDPSGRWLRVDVEGDGGGAVRMAVTPHPAAGVAMMSDAFRSPAGEAFYGFGGRHDALDQRGRALTSFVEEENLPGVGAAGTPAAVLFPNGPTAAYYPQSQFVSSAGYGFLLDQPELARFRLDSDRPDAWSVGVSAPSLSYVVVPGAPRRTIGTLTGLTGRQPAPPEWALGPMLDRLVKNVGETRADYTAQVYDDLRNLVRFRLPITAYRLEGWGFANPDEDGLYLHPEIGFADQEKVVAELRRRGIHPLAYLRPWITPGSLPDREGLTVRDSSGRTYVTTGTTGQKIAMLDFTDPAAVDYWKREVGKVFDLGFDGFMQDFGEEVMFDMHFADGETGRTMHNRYPVLYMRATREAIAAYHRTHPRRALWFFNRAGYTRSARYEGGNFPGDESTDWTQAAGLGSLAPDMLSRGLGGAYGFGTDIGGYYDYTSPPTSKELFLRWAEWAALSPIFRLHGSGRSGTHTPWSYGTQTVVTYRALSLLHERAAPLILRLWRLADATGLPPTRPLWLEFPGDPAAAAQQQEWTLGNDVLVAPVVQQGATSRAVYFPNGCWHEPSTGRTVRGPASLTVPAPLTRLPYFFRCGTNPLRATARRCKLPAGRGSAAAAGPGREGDG